MKRHPLFTAFALLVPLALAAEVRTPAMQKIDWAKASVEKNPKQAQPYVDLAFALARRARETADPAYYKQAHEALAHSLRIDPANFEARKARVWILLGQHEFKQALDEAVELNRQVPDDQMVYGMLADANVELGNYKEAEKAAQTMFDMRGISVPALTRGAYLREIFNDIEGALEFMNKAYQMTPPQENEDRAWVLTHVSHLELLAGRADAAESAARQALELFPEYHYALAQLAKVKSKQGKHEEAAALLKRRYEAAAHPENLYELGEGLERAGKKAEARQAFAEFERKARAEMENWDNSNRELIAFYLRQAKKPREALRIARMEAARRRDMATIESYASALRAAGMHKEAEKELKLLAEARGLRQ